MVPLQKQKWDDPLSSVGDYRGIIEIKTNGMFKEKRCCWEAKDGSPASNALKQLLPRINELFQTSGDRVPDSAMVLMDVFMLGETAEGSTPYIMFSCPNTCRQARIKAMNLVRRSGLLKEFPGLRVFHWEFPPHIPDPALAIQPQIQLIVTGSGEFDEADEASFASPGDRKALEIFLAATFNGKFDASLSQKSTIGAFVRVGKCVLHFTAAHMLLPECDTTDRRRSQVSDSMDVDEYGSDYFSEDESPYESEDDDRSIEFSDMVFETSEPSTQGQGTAIREPIPQCPSWSQNSETELLGTPNQHEGSPVVLQKPRAPHFTNGEVFFKSQELDFALLDLSDFEVHPCNIPELGPDSVSEIRPGSTKVVACVASRRDLRGLMSGRPSYIRFPHGGIYREVYPVCFSADVQVGDSGTVVRDLKTRKIYGHIVVASIASRTAFIVPATQVLQAIPWLRPDTPSIYSHLDTQSGEIRLVRLLPSSSSGDGLCCEHSLVKLRDRPKYEALLYAWGDQEGSKPILLNGKPWTVRPTLAAALRRLRHEGTERYLWIDALCINQSDPDDKRYNLRLMDHIFRSSVRCLAWVGDVYEGISPSTSWTFLFKHPSTHQWQYSPARGSVQDAISQEDAFLAFGLLAKFGDLERHKEGASVDDLRLSVTPESQRALGNLMALPWWKRFWPFLRAISTPSTVLMCGTMCIDLDLVGNSAFTLRKYLRQKTQGWRRRGDALDFDVILPFLRTVGRLQRFRRKGVPEGFNFAVNATRDLDLDPKRKVFALLKLSDDVQFIQGLNYSLSINQICESVTSHQLLRTKSLFPLVRTTEVGRNVALPSWVPDWAASVGNESQFHSELSFFLSWDSFDASSGRDSIVSIHDHTLQVQGLLVDTVSTAYGLMESGMDLEGLMFNLTSQLGEDFTDQTSKLTGASKTSRAVEASPFQRETPGSQSQDLWRLLTCDIRISEDNEMKWRRARNSDRAVCMSECQHGLLGHGVRGRRLFSTKMRYFGLGSADISVGDIVVILFGGRFPFILRPTVGNFYSLVGYAYVLGIMDGEAVSDSHQAETFRIV